MVGGRWSGNLERIAGTKPRFYGPIAVWSRQGPRRSWYDVLGTACACGTAVSPLRFPHLLQFFPVPRPLHLSHLPMDSDLIIIGGGIVGLATAYRFLERFPDKRVTVLEKEPAIAKHQTGRNSGVMHTGIYYRPGSLKAVNCRAGKLAMEEFCTKENIPFDLCGKLIVAVEESELPRMEMLLERGPQNGVVCNRITPEQIREIEPYCAGLGGIHVPEAGVVDYARVCRRLAEIIAEQGSRVVTSAKVTGIRRDQRPGDRRNLRR